MKKNVLFALLATALACQTGAAQITLTSTNMPTAGKITVEVDCDSAWTVAQNIGTTGPNQAWDFSGAIAVGDPYPTFYVAAASTPFAADFPTASLASTDVVTDTSFYDYYKSTTAEFSQQGSAGPVENLKFTPALKAFKFPFKYLTSFNVDCSLAGDSDGTPVTGSEQDTVTCDAWGTVTTTLGTFPCLRVKRIIHQDITLLIFNLATETVQYEWWAADFVAPVFTYGTTKTDFFGITETTYSSYLSGQSVGSHNPQAVEIGLSISPNPAVDEAVLSFSLKTPETVDFLVYSTNGKLAVAQRSVALPAGENREALDLKNLPVGTYLVAMMSGSRMLGMKQLVIGH